MTETPETLTRSEFARLQGWVPSYVTKLAKAGRLVFTDDGKRVRVAESLASIKATEDPNRDDVQARWQGHREQAQDDEGDDVGTPQGGEGRTPEDVSFQNARARKEYYAAQMARIEYEKAVGNLVDAEQVRMASANAGAIIRGLLENLPAQLAPELAAEQDEARVQALLVEHIEWLLMQISDRVAESVA